MGGSFVEFSAFANLSYAKALAARDPFVPPPVPNMNDIGSLVVVSNVLV